jgi:metal-responsive CopG/Arc/MetJ family transcriptional regulator
MKTAVSLPDPLFDAADRMAKRLGMPRSRLYAQAVEAFVNAHHDEGVTEALNVLYGTEPSKLDPALAAMQVASLPEEDW